MSEKIKIYDTKQIHEMIMTGCYTVVGRYTDALNIEYTEFRIKDGVTCNDLFNAHVKSPDDSKDDFMQVKEELDRRDGYDRLNKYE